MSAISTLIVASTALAMSPIQGNQASKFERTITKKVSANYLVALPEGYSEKKEEKFPLILFLHGAGERGEDVEVVKLHGPPKLITEGKKLPFIVISPQCPPDTWWDTDTLIALLDEAESKYRVDKDRIYVTGLSMGGFGTFALAIAQPKRFAAIAPVCGGGDKRKARSIAHLPTWVVHGTADGAVPFAESETMVAALKAAGGDPIFTIIQDGQHDVWTDFYARDDFYTWLLQHKRKD